MKRISILIIFFHYTFKRLSQKEEIDKKANRYEPMNQFKDSLRWKPTSKDKTIIFYNNSMIYLKGIS